AARDDGDDVIRGTVEDLLSGIEPKTVEMKLVYPIGGVGGKEFTHRRRIGAIEVNRFAPLVLITVGKIIGRERFQAVAVRPEVIIDDIQNDAQADPVGLVNETPDVVGNAVKPRGSEKIDAVVPPTEPPWKIGDRHDFQHR